MARSDHNWTNCSSCSYAGADNSADQSAIHQRCVMIKVMVHKLVGNGWLMVGSWLVNGCSMVGHGWSMVDAGDGCNLRIDPWMTSIKLIDIGMPWDRFLPVSKHHHQPSITINWTISWLVVELPLWKMCACQPTNHMLILGKIKKCLQAPTSISLTII